MKFYAPFAKVDDEQRVVEGYASTEALDSQNEIVKREALQAALAPYMKFANIREMHGPSAVGVAHWAEVDDKGLRIGAKIVDAPAWEKVKAGVYKGFSIGGHVTDRDPQQRHVITGLTLTEISIVDRPANPDAMFDVWKAEMERAALAKEGKRNSEADQAKLNEAHDAIVAAGAQCAGQRSDDDQKDAVAKAADLAKLNDTLTTENKILKAELDALKAKPEPMKGKVLSVGKASDFRRAEDPAGPVTLPPHHDSWFTTRA
jgi:HK97 family phage prohead protease